MRCHSVGSGTHEHKGEFRKCSPAGVRDLLTEKVAFEPGTRFESRQLAAKVIFAALQILKKKRVIRRDLFVSDVFSIQGGQPAIPAVSACNTPASIEPCVFGADHAFQPSP